MFGPAVALRSIPTVVVGSLGMSQKLRRPRVRSAITCSSSSTKLVFVFSTAFTLEFLRVTFVVVFCLDEKGPMGWIFCAVIGLAVAGRSSMITCGVAFVLAECGLALDVDLTTILSLPLGLVCKVVVGLKLILCLLEATPLSEDLCPMLILDVGLRVSTFVESRGLLMDPHATFPTFIATPGLLGAMFDCSMPNGGRWAPSSVWGLVVTTASKRLLFSLPSSTICFLREGPMDRGCEPRFTALNELMRGRNVNSCFFCSSSWVLFAWVSRHALRLLKLNGCGIVLLGRG
mmetsp:Transcript_136947/g.238027  ORF Transcript_136947/g.238027 Transcript_136947/m.238027 type:complete len:289 (-) Transcript_136947:245-1111(-)